MPHPVSRFLNDNDCASQYGIPAFRKHGLQTIDHMGCKMDGATGYTSNLAKKTSP